ncbi:MAG: hypothetical protein QOF59_2140 [Actinomycetota bacterium]|nr:hypothetical protein [Actinomycetota bacterium]
MANEPDENETDANEDGHIEEIGGRWRLRFTRRLAHSPAKVWRAITEPEHLKAWFPDEIEGRFERGAVLRFVSEYRPNSLFEGEVIEFEPPSVLEFRWDTNETLRFEIRPDGDGSVLTFLDTFDELGKAARDGAGWHACLDVLAYDLDGATPPWEAGAHWNEVHDGYVERFGPEASSVGPPAEHPYVS